MVGCRSSRLNQNKPFSGPVSTLMSSSAEFYSLSLSGRLRAVGLNALTRLSTVIYMDCAIKSLHLLRQCDVDNLVDKQFYFQTKRYYVFFIKICIKIFGPENGLFWLRRLDRHPTISVHP